MTALRALVAGVFPLFALYGAGCVFTPPPPLPEELAEADAADASRRQGLAGGTPSDPNGGEAAGEGEGGQAPPPEYAAGDEPDLGMSPEQMRAYATAQGDPEAGDFTLAEALEDLPDDGDLFAILHTNAGTIACELFEAQAPLTVANFVGLARGLRPTRDEDTGAWTKRPYYDGVEFHRVIPGFMIQGGDPTGTGAGGTGYVIPDEFDDELVHDQAGILSMANRGPGTGSGQFFITLAPTPHLDGKHTIFGQCTDEGIEVAEKIAQSRGPGDRPRNPQVIQRVEIVRR